VLLGGWPARGSAGSCLPRLSLPSVSNQKESWGRFYSHFSTYGELLLLQIGETEAA